MQIITPVQAAIGWAVLDEAGHVIGVVVSKLDALKTAQFLSLDDCLLSLRALGGDSCVLHMLYPCVPLLSNFSDEDEPTQLSKAR